MRASKQFDKTRFTEASELEDMLKECHKALLDIGLSPAPLDKIEIYYQTYKGSNHPMGSCYHLKNGTNVITLNKRLMKESREDRYYTISTIYHELVHTTRDNGGHYINDHGESFRTQARKVKEAYGYDLLVGYAGLEFDFAHLPVKKRLVCPCCGSSTEYRDTPKSLKLLQNVEKYEAEGNKIKCSECGTEVIWK